MCAIMLIPLLLIDPFVNNGLAQTQNGRVYLILRVEVYLDG